MFDLVDSTILVTLLSSLNLISLYSKFPKVRLCHHQMCCVSENGLGIWNGDENIVAQCIIINLI